jgi:hypothetical protein
VVPPARDQFSGPDDRSAAQSLDDSVRALRTLSLVVGGTTGSRPVFWARREERRTVLSA